MNNGTQIQTENQEIDGANRQQRSNHQSSEQLLNQSFTESGDDQLNSQSGTGKNPVELKYRSVENVSTAKFAKGLGYFSIALGLAELLAPGRLGEMIGVNDKHRAFLPVLGLREIAHGVGILSQTKPTESVWSRVGGDAVDLAFLGSAFASDETNKKRLIGATIAVLGTTALDVLCAQRLSNQKWSDADKNPLAPTTVGQSSGRQTQTA